MKVKDVILVTALFMMAISICNTTYGQAVWIGEHSPTVAYNPVTHAYLGIHQSYTEQWNPWGRFIDPWGGIQGIVGLAGMRWECADDHCKPSLAYNKLNNNFFAAWTGEWPYHDLYGELLDANAYYLNSRFVTVSSAPGTQTNSIVTPDDVNGRFLVTWMDDRNMDGQAIYGQLVSAEGELYSTEILIQSGFSREYPEPYYAVAFDNVNQKYLVVWSWKESISGQFINANGTLEGEKFTIVEYPDDDPSPIGQTSLAYDSLNQRYLLVWVKWGPGLRDIVGQLMNSDGTVWGTPLPIVLSWEVNNPSVAYDHINQRFLVAWSSDFISGQFVIADGTFQGDKISISYTGALFWDVNPAIAFNPECGNFLVAGVSKTNLNIPGIEAIQSAINYTVVGDPCPSATLTVKMKGYGGKRRSITGTGINCKKKACTGQYLPGSEVSISAWVDGSYGDGIAVTLTGCDTVVGNDCHITMDSDKNVTAKFVRVPKKLR